MLYLAIFLKSRLNKRLWFEKDLFCHFLFFHITLCFFLGLFLCISQVFKYFGAIILQFFYSILYTSVQQNFYFQNILQSFGTSKPWILSIFKIDAMMLMLCSNSIISLVQDSRQFSAFFFLQMTGAKRNTSGTRLDLYTIREGI